MAQLPPRFAKAGVAPLLGTSATSGSSSLLDQSSVIPSMTNHGAGDRRHADQDGQTREGVNYNQKIARHKFYVLGRS
jgi:hypothetical protein